MYTKHDITPYREEPLESNPHGNRLRSMNNWAEVLRHVNHEWHVIGLWENSTTGYSTAKRLKDKFPGFEFKATNVGRLGSKLYARQTGKPEDVAPPVPDTLPPVTLGNLLKRKGVDNG